MGLDTSKHKFPKGLDRIVYSLISQGVKTHGTYNPSEIFYLFEESLTGKECLTAWGFLEWCHNNGKTFGHANYEERYQEFLKSKTAA